MNTNECLDQLANMCHGKDWFNQVGLDQFGRLVVYVNYLTLDVYNQVPNTLDNKQVLVHYVSSKETTKSSLPIEMDEIDISDEAELLEDDQFDNFSEVAIELDRLEKICGANILSDIFFEVNDLHNAITNLSVKFPEVRSSLEKLYEKYGFDILYEEINE